MKCPYIWSYLTGWSCACEPQAPVINFKIRMHFTPFSFSSIVRIQMFWCDSSGKKKGLEPVCGSIFTLTQSVSLKQTDAAGVRTAKCYCHMSLSLSPSPHDSSRAVRRLLVGKKYNYWHLIKKTGSFKRTGECFQGKASLAHWIPWHVFLLFRNSLDPHLEPRPHGVK